MRVLLPTLCLAALLLPACAQLPPRPVLPFQAAPAVGPDSALDKILGPVEALHADSSGFRLMSEGPEAFAVRAHASQLAERSLDVQTYIWHVDLVGRYLVRLLLDAADRGVKVRLLLDDLDARANNYGFAALSAHPNIDVRIFNPLASRWGKLRSFGEFMTNGKRLNYRMHNKTWIADNRLAIVGGRNVGDEYFGASGTVNFVDLDFAMVGPVVRDISASFDRYWNSSIVYPLATLSPDGVNAAALEKLRARLAPALEEGKQSGFAEVLQNSDAVRRFIAGDWPAIWSSHYCFIADEPIKATRGSGVQASEVLGTLAPALRGAQHSVTLISPYFVPGESATAVLSEAAQHGRQVRILTNSLAATDVAAVHGGYAKYRKPLLEGGVSLWEMKPLVGSGATSSFTGSRGASLHTKALAIDDWQLFVGSYNLDPRSTSLNTEQGVLVMNAALATQFESIFAEESSPPRSWRVTLSGGKLSWTDGSDTFDSDPRASAWRRFTAWLTGVLPIEKQL